MYNIPNKLICNNHITFFARYANENSNDSEYIQNYKNILLPTYIENVSLQIKNNNNASITSRNNGDSYSLLLSLENNITKIYRNIDGKKYYLQYIDYSKYKSLDYESQQKLYFTIKKNYFFISPMICDLPMPLTEQQLYANIKNKNCCEYIKYNIDDFKCSYATNNNSNHRHLCLLTCTGASSSN